MKFLNFLLAALFMVPAWKPVVIERRKPNQGHAGLSRKQLERAIRKNGHSWLVD